MKFSTFISSFAALIFSCVVHSDAQEELRYILLRSGKIIEGKPFAGQEKTRIELAGGDYFVIPNEKLEKSFRQRRDIYNYKAAITPLQTNAQNGLMQWLVTQKNYDFAKQHLTELKIQANRLPNFDFQYWTEAIQNKKVTRQLPTSTSRPARSNALFKNKVENHLVLGCAISGCHRTKEDSGFFLANSTGQGNNDDETNIQKTKEILKRIGKKSFLQKVSQKHGSLKAAMYPTATREYLDIATWVNSLEFRNQPPRISSNKIRTNQIKSIPTIQNYKSDSGKSEVSPASFQKPFDDRDTNEDFVARDEFDPEIFNRLQKQKTKIIPKLPSSLPKPEQAPRRLTTQKDD